MNPEENIETAPPNETPAPAPAPIADEGAEGKEQPEEAEA